MNRTKARGREAPLGKSGLRRIRLVALIVGTIALGYAVLLNSAGFILRGAGASAAVALGVLDARARADYVQLLYFSAMENPRRPKVGQLQLVERRATAILRRDLLVPTAWRLVGMSRDALANRTESVTRLYEASEYVSRLDIATTLLLFQKYAKAGRIPQAFDQLDLALRQSDPGRSAILPVLVHGVANAQARPMLRRALAEGVSWREDFFTQLAKTPPPDEATRAFLSSLPRKATRGTEATIRLMAANLVLKGYYRSAQAALAQIGDDVGSIRNGGFERPNHNPPLDWEFQAKANYDAAQGDYGGKIEGRGALQLRASTGISVQVARQILFLRPGTYRLAALAGSSDETPLAEADLVLACAANKGAVGQLLGKLAFVKFAQRERRSVALTVPQQNCAGQWLMVTIQGASGNQSSSWLDSISLTRESTAAGRESYG